MGWEELEGAGRRWDELEGGGTSWEELEGAARSRWELREAGARTFVVDVLAELFVDAAAATGRRRVDGGRAELAARCADAAQHAADAGAASQLQAVTSTARRHTSTRVVVAQR